MVRQSLLAGCAWLVGTACLAVGSVPIERAARSMRVEEVACGDQVSVVAAKSLPPQFTMTVDRSMPTPGWRFTIDQVQLDESRSTVTVRATEIGPTGMTAQVITATRMEIPLGVVPRGRWFVQLWSRRGPDGDYRPAQAWVLAAH